MSQGQSFSLGGDGREERMLLVLRGSWSPRLSESGEDGVLPSRSMLLPSRSMLLPSRSMLLGQTSQIWQMRRQGVGEFRQTSDEPEEAGAQGSVSGTARVD